MAGKLDIGPRIGIEGEAEYRKQMANIIQQAKTLDSEMKLVTSAFTAETSAQEKASAQSAVIAKQIENQKNKISELEKAYERASATYGENDTKTLKLKESINKASVELNNMEKNLENVEKATDETGESFDDSGEKASTFGEVLKANLTSDAIIGGLKATVGLIKDIAGAAAGGIKEIGESYGEYEQLAGGIEKIFGDASESVKKNANEAYAAQGLSANQYLQAVTGFSSSLINSLGGDTEKAAEIADMALSDIADNANTYGKYTADELTNVYSALAKGNYNTLDNLTLGFAGTKEGMQSLIDKANELKTANGEMGDLTIESYADIVEAIHVVQTDMQITDTTVNEASRTIQGSLTQLSASWENLKIGLGNPDADVKELANNVLQSIVDVKNNVIPLVQNIVGNVSELVTENKDEILNTLKNDISPAVLDTLDLLLDTIVAVLPEVLDTAGEIVITLADGILKEAPELIPVAAEVINKICDYIIDNLDLIIDMGVDIIVTLAESMSEALPQLLARLPEITAAIIKGLGKIVTEAPEIGINLIRGLWEGIGNMEAWIISKVKGFGRSVLNGLKDFFGIHSPSTLMEKEIGNNLGLGLVNGFEKTMSKAQNDIKKITKKAFDIKKDALSAITFTSDDIMKMAVGLKPLDMAADLNADGIVSAADARIAIRQSAGLSSSETVAEKSYSYGDINIEIHAAPGMDERQLADMVIDRISERIARAEEAFA